MVTRFLSVSMVSLVLLFVFAGCQQAVAPQKSADEVLSEAMAKMTEVKADRFEMALSGNFQGAPQGQAPGALTFDFLLNGALDRLNPQEPKMDLKVTGTFSVEGSSAVEDSADSANGNVSLDVDAAVLLDKDNFWFNVMKLDLEGNDVPELPTMITSLFGTWYVLPLPPEVQAELQKSFAVDAEGTTPEALEIKSILADSKVFINPQYLGTENVKGNSAWHYSVTVDKQAAVEVMVALAETSNSAADVAQLRSALTPQVLDSFDFTAEVWVDTATGIASQVDFTVNIAANEATNGVSGMLHYRSVSSDFDKPVTLTVPPNVAPFPVETLMGMMMGAAMMNGPSTMDDASMMMDGGDASMMNDATMMNGDTVMMDDMPIMMNAEDLL